MGSDDDDFRVRPGRGRDRGGGAERGGRSFAGQVRRASNRAGYTRSLGTGARSRIATTRVGRGRNVALRIARIANSRRVTVIARIVRHKGTRYRAAPLARHIAYLKRDGVTRDGHEGRMFDAGSDAVDIDAFAGRCEDDRHHFRFIISPEEAAQMQDLRAFTRELASEMATDLGTGLDWVAVDHWNTDNPHVHLLVRGVDDTGADLVIDRDYIRDGLRARAEYRATIELGPRSEQEIQAARERDVEADRWTGLDRRLQAMAGKADGFIDLRPGLADNPELERQLRGRSAKLERLGLARRVGPACWTLRPGAEAALRDLSDRTDIIRTIHKAMRALDGVDHDAFAIHYGTPETPVLGRLVERGLADELAGTAYAVIDGIDGRHHHLRFPDVEMTGDAKPGSIVEVRSWNDTRGTSRLSIATRSDLSLAEQVYAPGATWLDRQLIARDPVTGRGSFGAALQVAMAERTRHLEAQGLAVRRRNGIAFAAGMIETLRNAELARSIEAIVARTGLAHRPAAAGEFVSGVYRERVTLSSGRFAMIDDGLGFQLVPWRPALDANTGKHVTGTMLPGGRVDWTLARGRGPGL